MFGVKIVDREVVECSVLTPPEWLISISSWQSKKYFNVQFAVQIGFQVCATPSEYLSIAILLEIMSGFILCVVRTYTSV